MKNNQYKRSKRPLARWLCVAGLLLAATPVLAQPIDVVDDFNDGDLEGWRTYDPLAGVPGGKASTFEVVNGAFHIHVFPSPNAAFGPARAGLFYPTNIIADFEVGADVVAWDATQTQIGILARAQNLSLGQAEGYLFTYQHRTKRLMLLTVRAEQGYTLSSKDFPLDPTRRYRMVFSGYGELLVGKVYDLDDGLKLISTQFARDTTFTQGLVGLMAITMVTPSGAADVTYDNYSAKTAILGDPELDIQSAPTIALEMVRAFRAATNPWSVAVADFNGDGKPDTINVNNGSRTVSVMLGNGDGTLQAKKDSPVATDPQYVAVGDFNADGLVDAAVTSRAGNVVSVLLGKGDGTFQPKVDYPVGTSPIVIKTADLNKDQILDIVVNNNGPTGTTDAYTIGVLLGKGDGTFHPKVEYPARSGGSPAVVDVNGDGNMDLVTSYSEGIESWLGAGDGTFGAPVQTKSSAAPNITTTGDFNGDGKVDVAFSTDKNSVIVALGAGDGTFTESASMPAQIPRFLAAGDLDGDQKLDIVVGSSSGNSDARNHALQQLTVFQGMGNGEFRSPGTLIRTVGFVGPVVLADMNGDQKLDILHINSADFFVHLLLGVGAISGNENKLEIAWPTATEGFVLQGASELGGTWSDLPTTVKTSHGPVKAVEVEKSGAAQFFRLRKAP